MQKVTITGGAGFIGSHLVKYWSEKGYMVEVIDDLRTGYAKNLAGIKNTNLHKVSICDKDKISTIIYGSRFVFNLAAMISVPESMMHPQECIDINVKGLINVLEVALNSGVEKVIHSSSAAIYGDDPDLPKSISMKPNPKSPYGVTKLDGEYYLNIYSDFHGLKTTSLRYFNVFGPKQDPNSQYAAAIPIFVKRALHNEDIVIYGDGEQTRDFVFVDDVVKANALAALSPIKKGVYNVANGNTITINKLAELIVKFTNSKSNIVHSEQRIGDIKHSYASINETKQELNFIPNFNFENGLMETVDYFTRTF